MHRLYMLAATLAVVAAAMAFHGSADRPAAEEDRPSPRSRPQVILRDRWPYGPPPQPERNYYGPAPTIQPPMERVPLPAPLRNRRSTAERQREPARLCGRRIAGAACGRHGHCRRHETGKTAKCFQVLSLLIPKGNRSGRSGFFSSGPPSRESRFMSQRTPYIEIVLTVAVLAFVAFVIAGGFDQPADDVAQVTIGPAVDATVRRRPVPNL